MSWHVVPVSFLVAAVLALPCAAQPCPSVVNYSATPSPAAFSSIIGSPGAVSLFLAGADDPTSPPIPVPAPGFSLYGMPKATFQVNTNGFIAFDQALGTGFFTNAAPGAGAAPNDYITPWWDDLHTSTAGSVWYEVLGSGDVVVEWNTMEQFPANLSGENVTFQARFNASPANTIELRYDAATFASGGITWSATVGVEDALGAMGFDATGGGAANSVFPATNLTLSLVSQVAPGYNVTSTPFGMTSIAGMPGEVVVFNSATPEMPPCTFGCQGTSGAIFDDNWSAPVALPFPFQYFSQAVTQFYIDTNGFVRFQTAPVCGDFTNAAMGSGGAAGRTAPFWDDLRGSTTSTGQISYLVAGAPGSQTLTVEWKDLETWSGASNCADTGTRLNFQLVLHEATDEIEFKYGLFVLGNSPAPSGSIGATNLSGNAGTDASGFGTFAPIPTTTNYLLTPCSPCGFASNFGTPCPSSAGTSGGNPTSPNPGFAITQSGAAPGVPTILVLGLSDSVWNIPPPLPLPFPLAGFGLAGGCSLLASAEIMIPTVTSATGTSAIGIPIPPALAACAATVYAEWANITAAAPLTVQTSDGLEIVTG